MAIEGINKVSGRLKDGIYSGDAVEEAVKAVEDYPLFMSVGYGGLPNEDGEVELDAAFMDGDTLAVGAVGGIKDYKNPVSIAKRLSKEEYNNFLVGQGADEYAHKNGFERRNMLTEKAVKRYNKRKMEAMKKDLRSYDGHDTVGMIALDTEERMCAATSTSGLFMKRRGRVGDSPICGSGFYADSHIGGAAATGLGEDLMKGCISYETVRLMAEGHSPQQAAEIAIGRLNDELLRRTGRVGELSLVCMNKDGDWGAATNLKEFSFSVASYKQEPVVYVLHNIDGKAVYEPASEEWLSAYLKEITI